MKANTGGPAVWTESRRREHGSLWKRNRSSILLVGLMCLIFGRLPAADAAPVSTNSIADISLEDLVNIKVTSVSKKEENLNDAAAAISVLSNDDLRRSGATSVAEALRLIPGMEDAQINSSTWAISARGFDEVYSRSLLVLVDGRAVYSPYNGGVVWDLQQQMLEDVDRIEVIRGPGGTLWGANAVNGVVNIVSKSARDTQGTLLYGSGGDPHLTMDGARYGGKLGENTYYRVFGSYQLNDNYLAPGGAPVADGWQGGQGGFRLDHYPSEETHATWQGDFTKDDLLDHTLDHYDLNTLGRWSRTLSDRSSVELQAYVDRLKANHQGAEYYVNTIDVAAQHTFGLGERNDVIWGLDYRLNYVTSSAADPTIVRDPRFIMQLASVFVQDEFKLVPDKLTLTAGTKIEHNSITGFEFEPSVRAMFKPATNQTLWAAVSRAVITPTFVQGHDTLRISGGPTDFGTTPPTFPSFIGNPNIQSSTEWAYELGYRIQPVKRVSVDIAAYFNQYTKVITQEDTGRTIPGPPGQIGVILWNNTYDAQTYGGEASITVEPVDSWRLTGSYSLMRVRAYGRLVDTDAIDGSPMHQAGLRSSYDFTRRTSLDAQLRYVTSVAGASAYVTADVRLSYRPTSNLEFALAGQNLFQKQHVELGADQALVAEIPRGFYAKVTWRF
jgi:iron complex outermembrane receptor protein